MLRKSVTVGGHVVPAGTKCLCVTKHIPSYAHCMPYELPDGHVLYLCPNTYHATKTLLQLFRALDGVPAAKTLVQFAVIPQRLAKLHWRLEHEDVTTEQILSVEKLNRLKRGN